MKTVAVGRQSYEMKDSRHLLSPLASQPVTGSHSWQPTPSICEKLSGCTLNRKDRPTLSPGPSQLSVRAGQWAGGLWRSFIGAVQPSSQTTPAQHSDCRLIQSATVYNTQAHRWTLKIVQVHLGLDIFLFYLSLLVLPLCLFFSSVSNQWMKTVLLACVCNTSL